MNKEFESLHGSGLRTALILCFLSYTIVSNALPKAVKGTVVNKSGEKLSCISVQVKGTNVTTATDALVRTTSQQGCSRINKR